MTKKFLLKLKIMNTTSIGRQAEDQAAKYLSKNFSYKLLAKNWRTRTCEIDLIMVSQHKAKTIHFIEVKYRKSEHFGGGINSINKNKLSRMHDAAQEWLEQNPDYSDYQINIAAIEITGSLNPRYTFIDSINYDS
jgi:uncharacterized protein (TIGR00252 family)